MRTSEQFVKVEVLPGAKVQPDDGLAFAAVICAGVHRVDCCWALRNGLLQLTGYPPVNVGSNGLAPKKAAAGATC